MVRLPLPLRLLALTLVLTSVAQGSAQTDQVLSHLRVPTGFSIELFTDQVPNARSMTLGREGTVFVGTRQAGKVYAVSTRPDGARLVTELASGLNAPNGVAFQNGALYIAEVNRIVRIDNVETASASELNVVRDDLPRDRHHGWRYIAFGPDGRLYVTIGAPCNVCNQPKYATITRMNADGSEHEVFAQGVRNSQGLDWHPQTRELWFTDNGRDWLGEDAPPCELNRATRSGQHFGFPFCHGAAIDDPEFGHLGACSRTTSPAQSLGAHVAPLGMKFYTGRHFPPQYRGQIFIAEHGSWNRKVKSGYRITRAKLDGDKVIAYEPFVIGFQRGDQVYGRPTDVLELPDGSMLISDDHAGAIYRVTHVGKPTRSDTLTSTH